MIPLMEIASMDSQISVNQLTPVREFNEAAKELGENLKKARQIVAVSI